MDFPFVKQAVKQLFSKPSCDMYPFVPSEAAPNYRGRIAYDPNKCIGCGMCVRVCAGKAITLTREPVEGGENITLRFDLGSCTFCNTCADFCNENAITLTGDYHMVATKEEDLIVTGTHFKEKKKPAPKAAPKAPAAAAPAAAEKPVAAEPPKASVAAPAAAETPKAAEKPSAEAAAPAKTAAAVPAEAPAAKAPEAAPAEEKPAAPAVQPRDDGKPVNDPSKCIYCTLCAKKCPQEAITVDRKAKTWELNDDDCVCCGTCQSVCPKDAIIM